MAKFYGAVGFVEERETGLSVHTQVPVERMYRGDLIRNGRRLQNGQGVNDDVTISNQISIVADPYANEHIFAMRYVKWRGVAWKVTDVDVETPRLNLTLGGVYNGEVASDT